MAHIYRRVDYGLRLELVTISGNKANLIAVCATYAPPEEYIDTYIERDKRRILETSSKRILNIDCPE
jgi:hypothetical protein